MVDDTNIELINRPATERILMRDIAIEGMTCDRCVQTVERALRSVRGVSEVKVDRAQALAKVTFDPAQTDIPELHDALLKSGYTPKRSADLGQPLGALERSPRPLGGEGKGEGVQRERWHGSLCSRSACRGGAARCAAVNGC